MVVTDAVAQLRAVHSGHHLVGDDDIGNILANGFQRIFAALCRRAAVGRFQRRGQEFEDFAVVIDNQHRWLFGRIDGGRRGLFSNGIGRRIERNGESDPQPVVVLGDDAAAMQFDIFLDHRETDAGAVARVLAHEVAVEELRQVAIGHARPVVVNRDEHLRCRLFDRDDDAAAAIGHELHGIGQDVAHHRLHLDHIDRHQQRGFGRTEREVDFSFFGRWRKLAHTSGNQAAQVDARRENLVFALGLKLFDIQNAVYQHIQSRSVVLDGLQAVAHLGIGRLGNQLAQRRDDEAERSLQFVRHIDEEVHLLLRQSQNPLTFALFEQHLFAPFVVGFQIEDGQCHSHGIGQPSPPAQVPRMGHRQHISRDGAVGMFGIGREENLVSSARQTRQVDAVCAIGQ